MSSNTTSLAPLAANIEDSCRLLGIGKTTLYEEIKSGRLRAVKVGAKTLLPTEQFPGWLKSLPRKPKGKITGKGTAPRPRPPAGGAVP